MRTRRINKTVLVEEQTTPDRRTKTIPPTKTLSASKPQPKANLRYYPHDSATSSNSPNKMSLHPYLSSPRIMSRSLILIKRGLVLSWGNISDALPIFAGTCSDVRRN